MASLLSLADKNGAPEVSTYEPSLPIDLLPEYLVDKLTTSNYVVWSNSSTEFTLQIAIRAGPVPHCLMDEKRSRHNAANFMER